MFLRQLGPHQGWSPLAEGGPEVGLIAFVGTRSEPSRSDPLQALGHTRTQLNLSREVREQMVCQLGPESLRRFEFVRARDPNVRKSAFDVHPEHSRQYFRQIKVGNILVAIILF